MVLPLLAACSHDEFVNSEPGSEKGPGSEGVFMTVTLNPNGTSGTRSQTGANGGSSDGTEIGTDAENAVKTALIVIADKANNFIASSLVPGTDEKGSITGANVAGNPLYTATAKFDRTDINTYYTENKNKVDFNKINVYVYCNPTSDIISKLTGENVDAEWYNATYEYNGSVDCIWDERKTDESQFRGFTMTNAEEAPRDFPATMEEWNKYSTAATAFKLSGLNQPGTEDAVDNLTGRGAVKVQRMAARFDFRDGSQIDGLGNGIKGEPFTYAVVNNIDGKNIVKCKFYAMALTNMSKTQYYLERVSGNGLEANATATLCGLETSVNYVVSTNSQKKFNIIKSDFSDYFKYPFFTETDGLITVAPKGTGWNWSQCSDVVKGASDNYGDKSFHFWQYVTENTIPGPPSKQVNGQSTGVIFKSRMLPTEILKNSTDKWEQELYTVLEYKENGQGSTLLNQNADTDPILYSTAGNTLYVTWENVREAALNAAGFDPNKATQELDRKAPLYVLCFGNDGGFGTVTIDGKEYTDDLASNSDSANALWQAWENLRTQDPNHSLAVTQNARSAFKDKATKLGFTLYQSSEDPETGNWGYYCYYYYWNRHNDNLDNSAMGPMEFAVVRNNVYKLTVTKLNTLGHPRIPENDPDDPDPEDPDEKAEVYMTVSVDVLPWSVRLNNIEF